MAAYDIFAGIALALIPFALGAIAYWLATHEPPAGDPLSAMLYDLAGIAVEAAEQLHKASADEIKKRYAVDRLTELLGAVAKTLPPEAIAAAVEAAVYRLKRDKLL